jgi:hypothetical protein
MAQQTINVGTADKGNGDPLRTAFIKVNNNFNELYAALGADFENLETHLIPSEDDTYDLGSPTKKWRSLYVGANTIYLDNTPLTVEGGVLKVNGTDVGGSDRLSQNEAELVLTGGANPYTLFPAITGGDQLIIQGAEVSSVSGHLALTSQNNLYIIANGSGAAPGGSKSWTFGDDGSLTVPGDIRSEQAINIDINLGDSTLRRWTFGEDGVLNAPASSGLYNANLFDIRSQSNYTAWVRTSGQIGLASINSTGVDNVAKVEAISTQPAHVDITVESSGQAPKVWSFGFAGALAFPDGTEQTTAWTGSVSLISSGPTAPGSAVVAGENDVDFNFSDGVSTAVSITRDSEVVSAKAVGLTLASNYDVKIVTDFTDNDRTWTFEGSTGDVVLPRGSIIGETTNTTVITPPTASPGQSLVIRPTASQWTIESSGFIVYGSAITITLTLQSWTYFGTVNYEITGTGVTAQTLGRAVTGKLTYTGVVGGPDAQSVTWTIPAQSTITEFTFTITGVDGTASTGPSETDPALYYNFEFNALPTGYSTTVTNNGISNTEISHIHLVAGDPVNTDLYLGDDDQYVKIEKNAGDVVIGTNANTKNWTFGNDGNLTLPGELHGSPVISGGMFPSQVGRTVNITPADDASDKKFKFRIDQYGETFTRAYFDMPEAEVDKQVAAAFPHANNTVGYIFTQGTNINDDGLNNAFNIFYNSGNIKITAMETGGTGTLRTWKFGNDGILTFPGGATVKDLPGATTDDSVLIFGAGTTIAENQRAARIGINGSVEGVSIGAGSNDWTFTNDGSVTFPDATVQTTAWTKSAADVQSSAPSSPVTGQLWYDTDDGNTYIWTGSAWVDSNPAAAAPTVDITDTNGLTTTYYPTFVENRTTGQYVRADVDLTYRTDTNTLTTGNLTTGVLKIEDGAHEKFQTKADATGIVTHDCSSGHVFYHTSPDANWTVNLTNLNLSSSYATAVTLVIVQGATGYYPSAVQIGGAPQPLNWQANTTPTPSTNRTDVVTFSIINNSGTYTVLGQLTGF